MSRGLVVAAPASGSGKTVVTLGLIRALKNSGKRVGSLKIGPDYIDAGFHHIASGEVCRNYDPWGMRRLTLDTQISALAEFSELIVAEGVMGLFDGAMDGTGSTADAAKVLGWPIVLVVDVKGQAASAAAVIEGFQRHRADTDIAGVIFNRAGGERHER
ncbi:MAG: AAA family ATPase, partial [Rhodospirillaceae bacterium]|nr:AAA family ATPase [Rhodospirillaceae bacterium]